MLRLSATEANRRFQENEFARWGGAVGAPETSVGGRAKHGSFLPALNPDWTKQLALTSEDSVFAIGSCFARGIEQSLVNSNLNVLSFAKEFDDFELANADVTGRGFANKYSTFAIANEMGWALDDATLFPESSLVEVAPERVIDPHVNPTLKWLPWEPTVDRRQTISEVYKRIKDSQVVVITLGLVEAWYDCEAEVYLNMSATREMIDLHPDRYVFEVTGFDQNRQQLDLISSLLRQTCSPDLQVVVTVSPVPLNATFSGRDVAAANAYSKAVLRAAAEEWCFDEPNVHYFPSYEIVTITDKARAWEADGRHVQGSLVNDITGYFKSSFVEQAASGSRSGEQVRERVREVVKRVARR